MPNTNGQQDPSATPVVTPLGPPEGDPQPDILHPSSPGSITAPDTDAVPASSITQSPSISVSSLSDFTIADTSGDESPINPTTITLHDTFYFEDGDAEVLCGNTLFRVHIDTLSSHSPVLRRMFVQASLALADSSNGCPRILSSDAPKDFAMLLKVIYIPGYVTFLLRQWTIPLNFYLQIPRAGQSHGFRHVLVPPANHIQV